MKVLDYHGLTSLWNKIKTLVSGKADKVSNATANNFAGLDANGNLKDSGKKESDFALRNVTYGEQGYISYSADNPDILLEKLKLGSLSLYNYGTTIQIYEYDAGDEENATLVWDSSNLTGTALQNFQNGKELGTIYTSPAGKCVKVTYNGAKYGGYNYIRAFGVFMTPKQVDSSHKATAIFRINGTNYKSYTIDTYGSLVTGICCNGNYTSAALLFTPNSDVVRMRFYGFRCLNTYAGTDGVLIGRSSSTLKLSSARKLAVNLANTSTDSTFDGSADQTGIKVSGKLSIANGGTNATTAADARTNLGAQASLPTTGTASDTYAINISGSSGSCTGNAATATKATQDSDGNAINATYFKSNTGTTTLQSGTAVKVGTQNGADVKLQLPTIPSAANNGALKIGLNGGTATSKFTANQSGDSTLTFASGTTAGTIKVDGTEVAVAGWSNKYEKPSTGIPKSDLASGVQTSLGKADTALQSESDPVFSASAAAGITSSNITAWNGKYTKPSTGIPRTDLASDVKTGLVDFYDITVTSSTNTMIGDTYNAIAASITAGRMVFLRNDSNPLYRYLDATSDKLWFYSPFEKLAISKAVNNDGTHTFTVEPKADSSLSGISENSIQNKVVKNALDTKADASSVTTGLAGKEDRIATAFTSSTDYNDLIAHGLYEVTNSPAAGTRNSPESGRISLWANKVTDTQGYYVTQFAIGDDAYIRRTYNQGAAWTSWTFVVESSNCKRILLDNAIGSDAGTLYII